MSCVEGHMKSSLKNHVLGQVLDTEKFKAFYLKKPEGGRMMSTLIMFTPEGIVLCGDLTPTQHGTVSVLGYGLDWFSGQLGEDYLCEKFLQKGWHSQLAVEDLESMAREVIRGAYDEYSWTGELRKAAERRRGLVDDLLEARRDLAYVKAHSPEEVADAKIAITRVREAIKPWRTTVRDLRHVLEGKLLGLANDVNCGEFGEEGFYHAYCDIDTHFDGDGLPGRGYAPEEAGWLCAIQQKFSELYHARAGTKATE